MAVHLRIRLSILLFYQGLRLFSNKEMLFEQLPLDIAIDPAPTLENFVVGENAPALNCLKQMSEVAEPQLVYLWGPEGVGKTHLAQAMGLIDYGVPVFSPDRVRYAVDEVDTLSENGLDLLFALINEIRVHPGTTLVMTGRKSPAEKFVREDILTRLTWGAVFQIKPLKGEMWEVLMAQAMARGIVVTPEAQKWMQTYLPRGIKTLSSLLSQMDRELLALKKNAITVPELKKWLDKQTL